MKGSVVAAFAASRNCPADRHSAVSTAPPLHTCRLGRVEWLRLHSETSAYFVAADSVEIGFRWASEITPPRTPAKSAVRPHGSPLSS